MGEAHPGSPSDKGGPTGVLHTGVPTYLLAWTTTPWTLPGNTALAVDPDAAYSVVEMNDESGEVQRLALATTLLEPNLKQEYRVIASLKGADLVGVRYTPSVLSERARLGGPAFRPNEPGVARGASICSGGLRLLTPCRAGRLRVHGGRHRHRAHCSGFRR